MRIRNVIKAPLGLAIALAVAMGLLLGMSTRALAVDVHTIACVEGVLYLDGTEWDGEMGNGTYRLGGDIDPSGTMSLQVKGDTTLDLGGYALHTGVTVQMSDSAPAEVYKLTITDSSDKVNFYYIDDDGLGQIVGSPDDPNYQAAQEKGSFTGGYITGKKNERYSNGTVEAMNSTELTLQAGTIIGSQKRAVCIAACKFLMEGGNIIGCKNQAIDSDNPNGSVTMMGGTIKHNHSQYGIVFNNTPFKMSGGSIVDNTTERYGAFFNMSDLGQLALSGNATIAGNKNADGGDFNVFLKDATSKPIVIDGKLANETPIGITMGEPGVFTNGWGEQMGAAVPTKYFASDDPAYTIEPQGGELTLSKEPDPEPTPTPSTGHEMFRLYNPNSGEHFYTASPAERDSVVAAGWSEEGVGWTAPVDGAPVYRLYNANAGEHHYTTSPAERDALVAAGWNDEGIGWRSADTNGAPIWRQYNPNAFANNHNFTASSLERDTLLGLGWNDEGIAWYGMRILK